VKSNILLSLVGGLLFWPAAAIAQTGGVMTLKQAVDEALVNNDRLLNEHAATEQAELGVRLAKNDFQPQVIPNVTGSFGQSDVNGQSYRVDLSQRLRTGTKVDLSVGTASAKIAPQPGVLGPDQRFYNADTTVTLTQPLLRGFGRQVAGSVLATAKFQQAQSVRQQKLSEQEVAIEVATAYYRLVALHAFVDVARQSVDRSKKLAESSQAKLTAGLVSQLDVLRAQQLVTDAETQLFDALSAAEDARDRLRFVIGRHDSQPIDVVRRIPAPEPEPIDADQASRTALDNRVDLQARDAERAEADRQVRVSRNQLLPQVDVNLALARRQTANSLLESFRMGGFQVATFFTISMAVDRTAQTVALQNAVLERDRRTRDRSTLERQVATEVRSALRDRDRLRRQLAAAETNVGISETEVDVARLRFEHGLSDNLDVVNAEASLLAAESRRIQVLADAALARLRLRATLGVLNPATDMDDAAGTAASPVRH